ncbi:MAG: response regulator [Candidatus Electrothrix sp. Rat3]|nr:response regulator [Candidatus Electrothrix rattekaaiensis]
MNDVRQQDVEILQKTVKFFEAVLAASQDGILITHEDATILVANQSFCSLFDCSPGDLSETSLFDWLSAFERDPVSDWIALQNAIYRKGVCSNIEFELMSDGVPQFFSVNASSLTLHEDDGQGAIAIVSIWRDITLRKSTEAALEHSNILLEQRVAERTEELRVERDNFAHLLRSMKDGCYIVNQKYDIQFVNHALAEDFGSWQGHKCYAYFHDIREPCSWCKNDQVFAGNTMHWEWCSKKNGKTYDIIETPMAGQDGSVWKLLILRDITERIRSEREKERITTELIKAKKMEAMGVMAGGVAHDLNNILTGIVGYPELVLMRLPQDSELRKPVEAIRNSGRKAATVVADLLTVARGAVSIREIHNLNVLIKEYLNSPECEKLKSFYPNIIFRHQLEATHPVALCSPIHIGKCLVNLVTNAAEAIGTGADGTVVIATLNQYVDAAVSTEHNMEKGDYLVLTVQDTGPGIPQTELEHIFEPFYTKKVMGRSGTGLGLTVAWNTMKDHNGKILVESNDTGTCFRLYFPVRKEEGCIYLTVDNVDNLAGYGERILLVDDERESLDVAKEMLETLGYRVETVCSGEQAVQFVKDTPVDLIVLDMLMEPGINGRQTYEEILKLHPGQKAVIASGFSESEDVQATLQLGVGGFVKKPYSMCQLGRAVSDVLKK